MKKANGQGNIVFLGKNRRRPYAVRMTLGYDKEGNIIRKYISYHKTKREANIALANATIHKPSADLDMTFKQVYEAWKAIHFNRISKQTEDNYKAAYSHLEKLHNIRFTMLKTPDFQKIINSLDKSRSTKSKIKLLCNQLYDYAMENDICYKNYAEYITLDKEEKKSKTVFTKEERKTLLANDSIENVDTILILIYTGMRIQEMLNLKRKDIDLEIGTITGGLKTDAGMDRVIPIHDTIKPYIERRCAGLNPENNLFTWTQNYYRKEIYYPLLERLKISKKVPHTTRHTCATMMAEAGLDPVAIKQILGHSSYSFTVETYTHTAAEYLINQVKKY